MDTKIKNITTASKTTTSKASKKKEDPPHTPPPPQKETTPPFHSIWTYFFIIGLMFLFIGLFSVQIKTPILFSDDRWYLTILFGVLLSVLPGFVLMIYHFFMKGTKYGDAYGRALLCVFIILFPMFVMIELLPAFSEIFENSIGYWILKTFPVIQYDPLIKDIFKLKPPYNTTEINQNTSFLITLFKASENEFEKLWANINGPSSNSAYYFTIDDKAKESLKKNVLLKNRFGKLVWLYLASVLSVIVSLKYVQS